METFVINLDRAPRKLEEFERANRGLLPYSRFPAVDGLTVSPKALVADGTLHPDLDYTPGAIGCALSHMTLWKHAVETSRAITICEDDAIFNRDFVKFADETVTKLGGRFDFVLWGWNFDSVLVFDLWGISQCAAIFDQEQMRRTADRFKSVSYQPTLYALHRAYGLVCYTIAPRCAKKLLDTILPLRPMEVFFPGLNKRMPNTGIDVVLSALYPSMIALVSFPPLVLTKHERTRSTTLLTSPNA